LIVFGWSYFIYTGNVSTIWPMFGMANQLLSLIALCVVTVVMVNAGRGKFAWVTLIPLLFVASTTFTAAYMEITGTYMGWIKKGDMLKGTLNIGLTVMLLVCVTVIAGTAVWRVGRTRRSRAEEVQGAAS
jgi:carbon starvation protein